MLNITRLPNGWERVVDLVPTWGTFITLELRAEKIDPRQAEAAFAQAAAELHRINSVFSTYEPTSQIARYRAGQISEHDLSNEVIEVMFACGQIRQATGGIFDPWAVEGGFDPSGYVKGWGADRVSQILANNGFASNQVNAAGDVTVSGAAGPYGEAWRIGITDPRTKTTVLRVVSVPASAGRMTVATSGRYERGEHIVTPVGHQRAEALSATVVHPDGGWADGLTKAVLLGGPDSLRMLGSAGAAEGVLVTSTHIWSTAPAWDLTPSHAAA